MRLRFGNMIAGTALVLVLAAWAMINTASAAVIADSQTGFSGVQGTNGWTYGYLGSDGSQGLYSSYDAADTMYGFGSAGTWYGDAGERVVKEGQHPGYNGTYTYAAVRRWTSDVSGLVRISGQLAKLDNGSGNAGSDGVVGSVYVNTTSKYTKTLASSDTTGVKYSFYAQVNVGDTINFLLDPRANHYCDATKFTATIANAEATTVDLADIVGGGNGHGTGTHPNGYNLATGEQGLAAGDGYSGNGFQTVTPANSFINGVFVPNVSGTNTQITSTGISADIAGVTASMQWFGVRNSAADTGSNNGILGGVNYDNVNGHTLIQMHADGGITFDLDAIRAANPGGDLTTFTTLAGIATSGTVEAGFRVYLDGVLKRSENIASDQVGVGYSISQAITSSDRFLTLVSTDNNGFNCDGIIFADPRLTFAVVPEPSSLILSACGLVGLIAYAWRKRRS